MRSQLLLKTLLVVASSVGCLKACGAAPAVSADSALQILMAGNARFATGKLIHPDETPKRRTELAQGQKPFAIVLTCADSRVAPELYFDQGLGDIFVLRNAGNVLDDHMLGSMEYAVEHLGVGLILVIGHSKCGAVSAAVAGGHAPGHIPSIVESIAPAVVAARALPGDLVQNSVAANARLVAESLRHCEPILREAVHAGHLVVVAARYDLATGRVEIFGNRAGSKTLIRQTGAATLPVAYSASALAVVALRTAV